MNCLTIPKNIRQRWVDTPVHKTVSYLWAAEYPPTLHGPKGALLVTLTQSGSNKRNIMYLHVCHIRTRLFNSVNALCSSRKRSETEAPVAEMKDVPRRVLCPGKTGCARNSLCRAQLNSLRPNMLRGYCGHETRE